MKFATCALLGAVYLNDLIEGRRTSSYVVTRAVCNGEAWEAPNDGRRLEAPERELEGRINLSQVVREGEDAGDIRVWSHWLNIQESDSYSLAMMSAQDCGGTETEMMPVS